MVVDDYLQEWMLLVPLLVVEAGQVERRPGSMVDDWQSEEPRTLPA